MCSCIAALLRRKDIVQTTFGQYLSLGISEVSKSTRAIARVSSAQAPWKASAWSDFFTLIPLLLFLHRFASFETIRALHRCASFVAKTLAELPSANVLSAWSDFFRLSFLNSLKKPILQFNLYTFFFPLNKIKANTHY